MSIVTQFLPKLNDAIAVVPEPQKGSRTHPSRGQDDLIILSNNLSGGIICFFNFLIIHISTLNPGSTIFQVKLVATAIIFYIVSYIILFNFYKSSLIFKK